MTPHPATHPATHPRLLQGIRSHPSIERDIPTTPHAWTSPLVHPGLGLCALHISTGLSRI